MKLVTEDKVVLSSVGCVIDKSTGITFPIHSDDTIDWDGGTHIHDIENEEWFDALSIEDIDIIEDILGNPTDTLLDATEADYLEMKAELAMGI